MARKLSRSEKLNKYIDVYFELLEDMAIKIEGAGGVLYLSKLPIVRMSSRGIYYELVVRNLRLDKDSQLEMSEDGETWIKYNSSMSGMSIISLVNLYKAVFDMS